MPEQPVLMSFKPKFVDMILAGEKDIELRRRLPSFCSGTCVFIYSTSPTRAVMGWTFVEAVYRMPKEELWELYGHRTGICWEEFARYFSGVNHACGIELSEPQHLPTPVSLEVLREYSQGFRPPQSYLFIKPGGPLADALGVAPHQIALLPWTGLTEL